LVIESPLGEVTDEFRRALGEHGCGDKQYKTSERDADSDSRAANEHID